MVQNKWKINWLTNEQVSHESVENILLPKSLQAYQQTYRLASTNAQNQCLNFSPSHLGCDFICNQWSMSLPGRFLKETEKGRRIEWKSADFTELGDIVNIDIMCGEILEHINKKLHSYLQNSLYWLYTNKKFIIY